MNEYINIIWEIIELIATVLECIMISYFVIDMLGYKNTCFNSLKTMSVIIISCINSIFVSAFIGVDSISASLQILICAVFSLIFLRENILYKIFVSALSVFFILIINSIVLTVMSSFFRTPIYILISTSGILRFAVLFLTKSIYFIVTRIMVRLSKSFIIHLSRIESIYTISVFLMTLIAGNILFEMISSVKYSAQISVLAFAALILINILNLLIIRKIHTISVNSAGIDRIAQEVIKQNERINHLYKIYPGNSTEKQDNHNYNLSDISTLTPVIDDAQKKCRKKKILLNYSISPCIGDFPENDISRIISNFLDEAISAYNRWEYKPRIDFEVLNKNKYVSIIISHYIKGSDLEMLMENKISETIPFNPYRNRIINHSIVKYNGVILRSQKRDKIITNLWLDFSCDSLKR